MRISDLSSDVCSSDLPGRLEGQSGCRCGADPQRQRARLLRRWGCTLDRHPARSSGAYGVGARLLRHRISGQPPRSEEHTSELQSLMRISYAVFCLKKKTDQTTPVAAALEALAGRPTLALELHSRQ